MKTTLYFLATFLYLSVSSCSKSDDAIAPEPVAAKYRVKKVTYATGIFTNAMYEYNTQGKRTRETFSNSSYYNYVYNAAGQIIEYERGGNTNASDNFKHVYSYDTNGVLKTDLETKNGTNSSRITNTIVNGLITEYSYSSWNAATSSWQEVSSNGAVYTYNSKKQIIKIVQGNSYFDLTYDEKGNFSTQKRYDKKPDGSYFLRYANSNVYDNQKVHEGLGYRSFQEATQINNILTLRDDNYNANGNGSVLTTSAEFAYDYNTEGYPTKKYRRDIVLGNVLLETYELEKL